MLFSLLCAKMAALNRRIFGMIEDSTKLCLTNTCLQNNARFTSYLTKSDESSHLPQNISEHLDAKKATFSPHRFRDLTSARISTKLQVAGAGAVFGGSSKERTSNWAAFNKDSYPQDQRVDSYDASSTCSLSAAMQTNVPEPFNTQGDITNTGHLPMPGGQWAQDDKYVSGEQQDLHYHNLESKTGSVQEKLFTHDQHFSSMRVTERFHNFGISERSSTLNGRIFLQSCCEIRSNIWRNCRTIVLRSPQLFSFSNDFHQSILQNCLQIGTHIRPFHTCGPKLSKESNAVSGQTDQQPLTSRQKLKQAVQQYGSTVIVFHVTISLASLGICYLIVSSGVDVVGLLQWLGVDLRSSGTVGDALPSALEGEPLQDQNLMTNEPAAYTESSSGDISAAVNVAAGATTFVVAYAVHKVFAPVRIGITLSATPFIVRYLRAKGVLRPPKA